MEEQNIREKIIEKSFKTMKENGLKITMDDIAASLGMSKKTIYKYFRTRSELIDAVIEHQMHIVKGIFKEAFSSGIDIMSGIQTIFSKIPQEIGLMNKKFLDDLRKFEPDKWDRIDEFRTKMLKENFPKIFREGKSKGYFKDDINFDILLMVYLSAVQVIINPTVLSQSSFSAKEAVDNLVRIFFFGITTEKGREKIEQLEKQKMLKNKGELE